MSSRHPAKHVNLKSNTIMKKPRCKYIKRNKYLANIFHKKIKKNVFLHFM